MHWRSLRGSRKIIIALFVVSTMPLCGCLTLFSDQDSASSRLSYATAYKLKVVSPTMPHPRVAWREVPRDAETLLTLAPDLPGCQEARFYYARDKSLRVRPIKGTTPLIPVASVLQPGGAADLWTELPDDPCAVFITSKADLVGSKRVGTLVFSTHDQAFRTFEILLPDTEPLPPSPAYSASEAMGAPLVVLLAIAFDLVLSPFTGPFLLYRQLRGEQGDAEAVTVSFAFPDGTVRATTVRNPELSQLRCLDPFDFGTSFGDNITKRCIGVECWARAAVLKLGFDFREEHVRVPGSRDPQRPNFGDPRFTMINGYPGAWSYRPHGTRDAFVSLWQRHAHAPQLHFSMDRPTP